MGKNKARHILHGVLDCLPIILIPVFMIYSQNHEINDNTLQVQENLKVDFNQYNRNQNVSNNNVSGSVAVAPVPFTVVKEILTFSSGTLVDTLPIFLAVT